MNLVGLRRFVSPEFRTSLFYLTFFSSAGGSATHLALWLDGQGIATSEIGWINSLPILTVLLLNLIVGRVADRSTDWRGVIVAGSVVSAVMAFGLFWATGFWPILVVWALTTVPQGLTAPVIDAATLHLTRRNKSSFSNIRGWGTVGFVLATFGMGAAISFWGGAAFVPVMVGFAVLRGLAGLGLPRFRAGVAQAVPAGPQLPDIASLRPLLKPWFVFPLIAFALVHATHFVLGGFAALVWRDYGINEAYIGPLFGLGAMAEVVVMFGFARIARRFTARHLILWAALATIVRWAAMALHPPLAVLALLQLTHGITFGFGYLGTVNFIANWAPGRIAAEAQSFAVMAQLSASVMALTAFGYFVAAWGASAFFIAAGMGGVAAVLVLLSLRQATPAPREDAE